MATATISTTTGDLSGNDVVFYDSSTTLTIGGGAGGEAGYKAWIPFAVALLQGTAIASSTLKIRASHTESNATCKIKVGCEAADNPSAPANWSQLDSRTLTSAYLTNNNVSEWTAGTEYTFDITTAVQEILNRVGWSSGNTMAVMIIDNASSASAYRLIASYDNVNYTEPILEIVYYSGGQVIIWSSE